MADPNFYFFFPTTNLNPQGWITDFITPFIKRTNIRSDEASIFYDKILTKDAAKRLQKNFNNESLYRDFLTRRNSIKDENILSINGNFIDFIDTDITFKDSRLTKEENAKYIKFMSNIKPHQLAFLQPYMRLSYGYKKDKKDAKYTFVEFPFSQIFDEQFVLNGRQDFVRGEGCGIKNISVTNKFNYVTRVSGVITINFFFANMALLTREINASGYPTSRDQNISDGLIYGFNFLKLLANVNPSEEIIRLEYGRRVSDGFVEFVDNLDYDLKSIIEKREKKVYYMIKQEHTFDFQQNGNISLGVKFIDFPMVSMLTKNVIFFPDPTEFMGNDLFLSRAKNLRLQKEELERTIQLKEEKIEEASKAGIASEISENLKTTIEKSKTLSEINRQLVTVETQLKDNSITLFIDKIKDQGQLFSVNFNSRKDKDVFNLNTKFFLVQPTNGNFLEIFEVNQQYDLNDYASAAAKNQKASETKLKQDYEKIFRQIFNLPADQTEEESKKRFGNFMFFPLKSLITAALSFLSEDERKKIPQILLGNVYIPIGEAICSINIGDLLVERDTFQKWYYKNCLNKDTATSKYSFGAFLSDIMSSLIPEIIYRNKTDNYINNASPSEILNTSFYLNDDNISEDDKRLLYLDDNIGNLEKYGKRVTVSADFNHNIPLIYFSQKNSLSSMLPLPGAINRPGEFIFNEIDDIKRGVMHIKIGADGGMIKNVSFNAGDNPIRSVYAYEAMANNAQKSGLIFYYSLNLTMFGNNLFPYNQLICVPFKTLGLVSRENDPGISGYYSVTSTTDSLDQSLNYTTNANCNWVYAPKNDKIPEPSKVRIPDPLENKKIEDTIRPDTARINFINYINKLKGDTPSNEAVPASSASPDDSKKSNDPPVFQQQVELTSPGQSLAKGTADISQIKNLEEYKIASDIFCYEKFEDNSKCNFVFSSELEFKKQLEEITTLITELNSKTKSKLEIFSYINNKLKSIQVILDTNKSKDDIFKSNNYEKALANKNFIKAFKNYVSNEVTNN